MAGDVLKDGNDSRQEAAQDEELQGLGQVAIDVALPECGFEIQNLDDSRDEGEEVPHGQGVGRELVVEVFGRVAERLAVRGATEDQCQEDQA